MESCSLDWELFLEYIKVFIWPLFAIVLMVIYRVELKSLVTKISQSKSIKTPFFEADISEVSDISGEAEIDQGFISLSYIISQSTDFLNQDLAERKRRAKVIFDEALNIKEEHLKTLIQSDNDELQIGAMISLNSFLQSSRINLSEKNEDYINFIKYALKSSSSLMRFRTVEVIKNNSFLLKHFAETLKEVDKLEDNNAVKMLIRFSIKKLRDASN